MIIVKIDPRRADLAMLTPILAQRLQAYALEHQPDVEPQAFTNMMMARLWAGDSTLLALMILDQDAGIPTGHLLAECLPNQFMQIRQLRADQNVGDARYDALDLACNWARDLGCPQAFIQSHRDGRELEKRQGWKLESHTLRRNLKKEE